MALITDLSASTTVPQPFQLAPLWSQDMKPQPTLCMALWLPIYGKGVSLGVSVWVWVCGCVGGWRPVVWAPGYPGGTLARRARAGHLL